MEATVKDQSQLKKSHRNRRKKVDPVKLILTERLKEIQSDIKTDTEEENRPLDLSVIGNKNKSSSPDLSSELIDIKIETDNIKNQKKVIKIEKSLEANDLKKRRRSNNSQEKVLSESLENRKIVKYDYTKDRMFQWYQPWVINTYGDLSKTKTITLKKYERIINMLKGCEAHGSDSSKFRFWMKVKGFTMEKPSDFKDVITTDSEQTSKLKKGIDLYVSNASKDQKSQRYRRVAVVEQFFDIIYNVHVGLNARSGRHAGQKRTYRTITESYAFLPRDAVTKFLSGCNICRRNSKDATLTDESEFDLSETNIEILESNEDDQRTSSKTDTLPSISKIDKNQNLDIEEKSILVPKSTPPVTNLPEQKPLLAIKNEPQNMLVEKPVEYSNFKIDSILGRNLDIFPSEQPRNIPRNPLFENELYSVALKNYYDMLRNFYEQCVAMQRNIEEGGGEAVPFQPSIQQLKIECSDSRPAQSVMDSTTSLIKEMIHKISPTKSWYKTKNENLTINSLDLTINVENNSKELRISCIRTPPKTESDKDKKTEGVMSKNNIGKVNLKSQFGEPDGQSKNLNVEGTKHSNYCGRESVINKGINIKDEPRTTYPDRKCIDSNTEHIERPIESKPENKTKTVEPITDIHSLAPQAQNTEQSNTINRMSVATLFKLILKLWKKQINTQEDQVDKVAVTDSIQSVRQIYTETKVYIKPLLQQLKSETIPNDLLKSLTIITKHLLDREYIKAGDAYLEIAIGNSLQLPVDYRIIIGLKRLMIKCQEYFPTNFCIK